MLKVSVPVFLNYTKRLIFIACRAIRFNKRDRGKLSDSL